MDSGRFGQLCTVRYRSARATRKALSLIRCRASALAQWDTCYGQLCFLDFRGQVVPVGIITGVAFFF